VKLVKRLKYCTIWFLDWVVDVHILRHSCERYCNWVAWHPWWGEE
jgi:hypothetical protein